MIYHGHFDYISIMKMLPLERERYYELLIDQKEEENKQRKEEEARLRNKIK